mmetsp:Transcript_51266/g.130302  ORF Transcript_51266/g.130302 Transcript_51266/m.130302 type:complete len:221 (-) Transcript_51266:48-710(-)
MPGRVAAGRQGRRRWPSAESDRAGRHGQCRLCEGPRVGRGPAGGRHRGCRRFACGAGGRADEACRGYGRARGRALCPASRAGGVGGIAGIWSDPNFARRGRVAGLRGRFWRCRRAHRVEEVGRCRRGCSLLREHSCEGRCGLVRQSGHLLYQSLGLSEADRLRTSDEHLDVGSSSDCAARADVGVLGLQDRAARLEAVGMWRRRQRRLGVCRRRGGGLAS